MKKHPTRKPEPTDSESLSNGLVPTVSGFIFGGDYNPEQWEESVWDDDIRLMRQAGVNLLSVGIFSWAEIEKQPGHFDFAWLDRILDKLAKADIHVCLATATASPPAWLAARHPSSLPVNREGIRLSVGSRQHFCPNSPDYQRYSSRLVRKIAERYRRHPVLAAWHIDNEYGCHVPKCYCDHCGSAFREWLRRRYGSLELLNARWGTTFWAQRYSNWTEIRTPALAPYQINPSQELDYSRFYDESIRSLYRTSSQILRRATPKIPQTTNWMMNHRPNDYFAWAPEVDFVSWDSYPDIGDESEIANNAMNHDMMRSFKPGHPFVLMEQATTQVNWRPVNRLKAPGQMRAISYQAIARGANGVMYFQWRASRSGAEKFHSAMVPHFPAERSRPYKEVCALGEELKRLHQLLDSRVHSDIAIVFDWSSLWALEQKGKPVEFSAYTEALHFYRNFRDQNLSVDFVTPESDWSKYRFVVAPSLYLLTDAAARNIEQYVKKGGSFLATYFTGIVDEYDAIHLGGYPATIAHILGVRVEEWQPLTARHGNSIRFAGGKTSTPCSFFSEVVHLEGAKAEAVFEQDFFAGGPALTSHSFGKGRAYYCATRIDPAAFRKWLAVPLQKAGVSLSRIKADAAVEIQSRLGPRDEYVFLINHADVPARAMIPPGGTDLLSETVQPRECVLEPFGVRIVRYPLASMPKVQPPGTKASVR